jgi:hypothetical protein
MPDGSDDRAGATYRVSYASVKPERRPAAKDPNDQASYLNESLTRAR